MRTFLASVTVTLKSRRSFWTVLGLGWGRRRLRLWTSLCLWHSKRDRRASGHDGLPKEFYWAFWELLGPDFLEVYKILLEKGILADTMRKGALAFLFKSWNRTELKNWRPLTLLTTDYKILAKVLALRLKRVMGRVLERLGFGPGVLSWLRTLYRQVYSCVRVNGFLSRPVEQAGGVRQGCPL
ncbi:hypothetical protein SKAU_G00159710 [Synaphobranchus kaupii]|uniref:Reverse transcriptase n=1 Tax=Synaphobranchus kaupii TaxID=118154 RepID=A0A9Q1IYS0_SYNKA|nr:hypothetical protein SKAU_G00159710 [Synaphobranchus kaupii]